MKSDTEISIQPGQIMTLEHFIMNCLWEEQERKETFSTRLQMLASRVFL